MAQKPLTRKRNDKQWEATRTKILDAAVRCYQESGAQHTSLQDIIDEAGISKPTLYRYFDNHDAVMSEAIFRELEQVNQELEAIQARQTSVRDMLIESFMYTLQVYPRRPLLLMLSEQQVSKQIDHLGLDSEALIGQATKFTIPIYELAKQQDLLRDGVTLERFVEWATRICISYMNVPTKGQDDAIEMRLLLDQFLVPSLFKT